VLGVAEAWRQNQRIPIRAPGQTGPPTQTGPQLYSDSPKRAPNHVECSGLVVVLKAGHKIEDTCPDLAIVDPAGMHILVPNNPDDAGGASKAIYDLLGLTTRKGGENKLPEEVVGEFIEPDMRMKRHPNAIEGEGRAVWHYYDKPTYNVAVHVIHVVGPHFPTQDEEKREKTVVTWEEAVVRLGRAYASVFEEAEGLDASVTTVRLPIISGNIFAGKYKEFDCLP
jgi:hypothetical protein